MRRWRNPLWTWWRWLVGRPDVVYLDDGPVTVKVVIDAWRRQDRLYRRGDWVAHLDNLSTYSLASRSQLREHDGRFRPLWLNVAQGRIESWSVKPVMDAAFDERGRRIGRR